MLFRCHPMAHMSKESSERRVKLENVLHRAATGQSLSDKEPANSRCAGPPVALGGCSPRVSILVWKTHENPWFSFGHPSKFSPRCAVLIIPMLVYPVFDMPGQIRTTSLRLESWLMISHARLHALSSWRRLSSNFGDPLLQSWQSWQAQVLA